MALGALVLFRFEKVRDASWLAIFDEMKELATEVESKDLGTAIVVALAVKEYSLNDHQFIRFTLKMKGFIKQLIVHFPRAFVIAITEGVPPEKLHKMGFKK
jgi:hypothetical protein